LRRRWEKVPTAAQVTLRTMYELIDSDRGGHIDTVVFNGVVDATDPVTGRRVRPCLVTLRTTRGVFRELDLAHVEPLACLKYLSAGVSKSPGELVPVRPVLEFSMVDARFVAESDVLSELDQRPNLMELTFLEFEALIQNLFTKMGLEARQTRPSRDGGVDCVAWDPRPIFGGKVVIQAKRYKNTVGVSAVRDLFGTLHNEGANKEFSSLLRATGKRASNSLGTSRSSLSTARTCSTCLPSMPALKPKLSRLPTGRIRPLILRLIQPCLFGDKSPDCGAPT
jgi:HJR/Mrr/RecB family endonuclease